MIKAPIKLNIEEHTLDNGFTVLANPIDGAPRIALSILLPGGNQRDAVAGTSDLMDRLVMKGTTKRSKEEISLEIDGLTFEADTETKRDYTILHTTLLEEDLEASLDLVSDLFYNATFDEFEREKEKMMGEVHMELDSPRNKASDQFIRALFSGTPYATISSVILENLPQLNSVDTVKEQYKQAYRNDHAMVSAAGGFDFDTLSGLLNQYFPKQNAPGADDLQVANALKSHTLKEDKLVTFARDDSSQAHIFKGWLTPSATHEDYAPIVVMNTILGAAGLSSRLFMELRDKQGLAYNVRSNFEAYQHRGMFYLYIGTEPDNKEKCLKGFEVECQKLMDTPVDAQELEDAKRNILGKRAVFLETAQQQANYVGVNYLLGRSIADIQQLHDRIEAVTIEQVQAVSQQYLSQPNVISVVGPSSIL